MLIYSTVIINNIIMPSYLKNILNIRYLKSIGSIAQYTTIPITKKLLLENICGSCELHSCITLCLYFPMSSFDLLLSYSLKLSFCLAPFATL